MPGPFFYGEVTVRIVAEAFQSEGKVSKEVTTRT